MVNSDADNFKAMMNALYSLYGKKQPDNDTLRAWWMKLSKIEFKLISNALDKWSDTKTTFPTVADILPLCRNQEQVYSIGKKISVEEAKANHEKLEQITNSLTKKPMRDWIAYWNAILDDPKAHKEITLSGARQALVNLGHKRV
jgi:hypothetical protein